MSKLQNNCPNCPRKYKNRRTLLRHLRYECGVIEKQFKCPFCDFCSKLKHNLKKHVEKHQDTKKDLSQYCPKCYQSFQCKDSLSIHILYECRLNTF